MRRALLVSLALAASACSTPPSGSGAPALADVWTLLGENRFAQYGDCQDVFGDGYVTDLGARGLACSVHLEVPLGAVLGRYAGDVYASGPHRLTDGAFSADLLSDDFGHYETDFVEWVVDNAIVGEDDRALRVLATPIYRGRFQRMARVYWRVYQDLEADGYPRSTPAGRVADYTDYLRTGVLPASGANAVYPGFTMTAFSERNDALAREVSDAFGSGTYYSTLYEANTAVGFWLRRREDGTHLAFRDGLRRLLATYDAGWLSES